MKIRALSVTAFLLFSTNQVHALSPEQYYNEAIVEASRFVEDFQKLNKKTFGFSGANLSSVGLSRFYKKNDRWVLKVRRISHGMVSKNDEKFAKEKRLLEPTYFEFKVLKVEEKTKRAKIEVRQVDEKGSPVKRTRLIKVVITVDESLKITTKDFYYKGLSKPVKAEFTGDSNAPMGFSSFPVDLPDFQHTRVLPTQNQTYLKMEYFDLFMRPVHILWKKGDLWPTSMESESGHIELIRQEKV